MVELVDLQAERTNLESTYILRWEDDGGQALEFRLPADDPKPEAVNRNNQPMTVPAMVESE